MARHLLSYSIGVHFMTRSPSSAKAQALVSRGATLCPGTYNEPSAVEAAMKGCIAVFMVFMPSFADLSEEARHAGAIVEAARAEGIKQAVYSSSFGIYDLPNLPAWDPNSLPATFLATKVQITDMVKDKFETWSIIRPAKFMSDFLAPSMMIFAGLAETGVFTTALRPHDKLVLVDPNTIGAFGAAALMEPDKFKGQEVDVFDQLVTSEELTASLAKSANREMSVKFLSDAEVEEYRRKGDIFMMMQLLMRDAEKYADMEKVSSWGIPLNTMENFLESEKARVVEIYGGGS